MSGARRPSRAYRLLDRRLRHEHQALIALVAAAPILIGPAVDIVSPEPERPVIVAPTLAERVVRQPLPYPTVAEQRIAAQIAAEEDQRIFDALDAVAATEPGHRRQPDAHAAVWALLQAGRRAGAPLMVSSDGSQRHPWVHQRLRSETMLMDEQTFRDIQQWSNEPPATFTAGDPPPGGLRGRTFDGVMIDDAVDFRRQSPSFFDVSYVTAPVDPRTIATPSMGATVPFPARTELTVLPADEPRGAPLGLVMHEAVGMAVMNPRGIERVNLQARRVQFPMFEIQQSPSISLEAIQQRRFDLIDRNAIDAEMGLFPASGDLTAVETPSPTHLIIAAAIDQILARRQSAPVCEGLAPWEE